MRLREVGQGASGVFVTFEGTEGTGKTTQIRRAAEWWRARGRDVTLTREPGGCPVADEIRAILLASKNAGLAPDTELYLIWAARAQHVADVVKPALAAGRVVLCDRFGDATEAYQGFARGLGLERVRHGNREAAAGLAPDLTLLFDMDAGDALRRAWSRAAGIADETKREDRFEREALEFHRRVREGYLAISTREPERVRVIDATGDEETVGERMIAVLQDNFGERA
ncbi:MAG: dTMP kinase [Deltaproteobacteria bacterium]|nr:dTMP kinase [Deltaproteobacteria bacterium]